MGGGGGGGTAEQRDGRRDAGGQVRRTGPAIYIFISSSWRAIGDREKYREKEKEGKRAVRALREEEEEEGTVKKNFGRSSESAFIAFSGFFIRFARVNRVNFNSRLRFAEKKKRDPRGICCKGEQRERHIPAVAYR